MNDTTESPVLAATNTTEIQPVSPGRSAFPGAPVRPSASVAAIAASTDKAPAPSSDLDRGVVIASLNDQPMATQGAGDLREATVEDIRSGNVGSERERDEKDIDILFQMLSRPETPELSFAAPPEGEVLTQPAIDQCAEAMISRIEMAEETSWETPDESLLADAGIPEPPVPSLFSDAIQSEIQLIAHLYSAPVAYVLASFLAAAVACLGNRMWFAAGAAWREVCVVWSILRDPARAACRAPMPNICCSSSVRRLSNGSRGEGRPLMKT